MMYLLINIGTLLIAVLHFWFAILEMFLWTKPVGLKIFNLSPSFAAQSAPLAANQGLYNLFICAGLCWGLFANDLILGHFVKYFFLICVLLAGIFAGITVNKRIFLVQGMPALIVLILLMVYQ